MNLAQPSAPPPLIMTTLKLHKRASGTASSSPESPDGKDGETHALLIQQ